MNVNPSRRRRPLRSRWPQVGVHAAAACAVAAALVLPSGAAEAQVGPPPPPLSTELPPLPPIDPSLPSLFLIGDSTVRVGRPGQMGWGEAIGAFFDLSQINLVNYARAGRSSRTFMTEGLWNRVLTALRPGDFVLIQFGHNDGGELFTTTRPRGSLPGTGEETREGFVEMTAQFEVVRTFGWYLRKYVSDARERGAIPVVLSLVPRQVWKDGKIVRDERAVWARDAARASGAAYIDLNDIVALRYEEMGPDAVVKLFTDDHTHTNQSGALYNAGAVVAGLKKIRSPLTKFLLDPTVP